MSNERNHSARDHIGVQRYLKVRRSGGIPQKDVDSARTYKQYRTTHKAISKFRFAYITPPKQRHFQLFQLTPLDPQPHATPPLSRLPPQHDVQQPAQRPAQPPRP
jgi:hypothetical protein